MPRANRHFLPGQIWHITHRCHEKSFRLEFPRDRRAYGSIVFREPRCAYRRDFGPEIGALRLENAIP